MKNYETDRNQAGSEWCDPEDRRGCTLYESLTAIGVTEGTAFQTVRNDRKMPVLLYLRETLIAVNRMDAERIEVEAQ